MGAIIPKDRKVPKTSSQPKSVCIPADTVVVSPFTASQRAQILNSRNNFRGTQDSGTVTYSSIVPKRWEGIL